MPSITELVIRIAESEARLAALVGQEEEAEAQLLAAAEYVDPRSPMWASLHAVVTRRRKLEAALAELLQSVRGTEAASRDDLIAEIEFVARFGDDSATGDEEDTLVPRWLLRKLREDAHKLL